MRKMPRKPVNYVSQTELLNVVSELGLVSHEQAGFIRVQATDRPEHRLYIAKTKNVGRVDVSGFDPEVEGVSRLGEGERFGKVRAQIDFNREPSAIIATFRNLCSLLFTLPVSVVAPSEKKERAPRAPSVKKESKPKVEASEDDRSARLARLAKIKEVAARMGAQVSAKVVEELETAHAEKEEETSQTEVSEEISTLE
jgi:hypothetical protein